MQFYIFCTSCSSVCRGCLGVNVVVGQLRLACSTNGVVMSSNGNMVFTEGQQVLAYHQNPVGHELHIFAVLPASPSITDVMTYMLIGIIIIIINCMPWLRLTRLAVLCRFKPNTLRRKLSRISFIWAMTLGATQDV